MSLTIEQQILEYLPQLGNDEKRSLLSVIKSFLNLKAESNSSETDYDEAFLKELDSRSAALENNSTKGLSWDEVKRNVASS